jgi:hypothetical protein
MRWIEPKDDGTVYTHGVKIGGKVTLHDGTYEVGRQVVLKASGYSENPGSRFSGLKAYYPATFHVLKVVGRHESGMWEVQELASFPVTRKEA